MIQDNIEYTDDVTNKMTPLHHIFVGHSTLEFLSAPSFSSVLGLWEEYMELGSGSHCGQMQLQSFVNPLDKPAVRSIAPSDVIR